MPRYRITGMMNTNKTTATANVVREISVPAYKMGLDLCICDLLTQIALKNGRGTKKMLFL